MIENPISSTSLYNQCSTLNYTQAAMMGLTGSSLPDSQQLGYSSHGNIPNIILTGSHSICVCLPFDTLKVLCINAKHPSKHWWWARNEAPCSGVLHMTEISVNIRSIWAEVKKSKGNWAKTNSRILQRPYEGTTSFRHFHILLNCQSFLFYTLLSSSLINNTK